MARIPRLPLQVLLVLAIALSLGGGQAGAAPISYQITDLGDRTANGINDAGQVVGYQTQGSEGFLYNSFGPNAGTVTPIGVGLEGNNSTAQAINNSGQILGVIVSSDGTSSIPTGTFLWENGQTTILNQLSGGQNIGSPTSINDSGQILAGNELISIGGQGQQVQSTVLGGFGQKINDAGGITGTLLLPTYEGDPAWQHAFFSRNGGPATDLGTLGGPNSTGSAINSAGQIVGQSEISSKDSTGNYINHAFLYSNGHMQDLGAMVPGLSSGAYGINNLGQIVGYSVLNDGLTSSITNGDAHAFLYQSGKMYDLNDLIHPNTGCVVEIASSINNKDQII